jgi:hypothetical protein
MEDVIQEIKLAFANTPYPGNNRIGTFELNFSFKGLHWKDVPWELLFFHRFEISSFTPEGFRFFLPAILLAVLIHHKEVDTLTETLIYRIVPPQDEINFDANLNFVELLTTAEKNAIYKFLLKCRELYPTAGWSYGEDSMEELETAIQFWSTIKDNP